MQMFHLQNDWESLFESSAGMADSATNNANYYTERWQKHFTLSPSSIYKLYTSI